MKWCLSPRGLYCCRMGGVLSRHRRERVRGRASRPCRSSNAQNTGLVLNDKPPPASTLSLSDALPVEASLIARIWAATHSSDQKGATACPEGQAVLLRASHPLAHGLPLRGQAVAPENSTEPVYPCPRRSGSPTSVVPSSDRFTRRMIPAAHRQPCRDHRRGREASASPPPQPDPPAWSIARDRPRAAAASTGHHARAARSASRHPGAAAVAPSHHAPSRHPRSAYSPE